MEIEPMAIANHERRKDREECIAQERCLVGSKDGQQLPAVLAYSFDKEKISENIGVKAYYATFLVLLSLEQHQYYKYEIESLIIGERLPFKSEIANIHPFYNDASNLIHIGGRIGYDGSGKRDL